jgi:hypothetical protein
MRTILWPKHSPIIPTSESRAFHRQRNTVYTPDKFETYNDWFYFIHLDPRARAVHAFGMVVGTFLYLISAYKFFIFGISLNLIITILTAAFFFFYLPLLSHYLYDGGGAKSTADKFIPTFLPVIHINLMTLTGKFDPWLREFIKKYPFTVEAWKLEEKEIKEQSL